MQDESAEQAKDREAAEFREQAEEKPEHVLMEFVDFLRHNKKWWLAPLVLALLILGGLVVLGGPVLPFIYPL